MMNEKLNAQKLLAYKRDGFSMRLAYKVMIKRYIVLGIILIFAIVMAFVRMDNPLLWCISGYGLGLIVRDYDWFRGIKKIWPFTEKTTDWDKVKEIAEGE